MTTSPTDARSLDQFYTIPTIARQCIAFSEDQLAHHKFDTVLEPSAGTGAFSSQLGEACLALDIAPRGPRITQADFLHWAPPHDLGSTVTIGNPPFGRVARKAIMFFNKAATFADAIAFIVPRSFRKDSIQRQLDRRFHFVNELVLPEEAFVFEGASYSVPSCFQVWERRAELRPVSRKATTHAAFTFCTPEEADFALQRVGANAGRIKSVSEAGSKNSHYFLRANSNPCLLRAQFELIDFDTVRRNTAGCPSISKSEIVHLFSKILRHTTM